MNNVYIAGTGSFLPDNRICNKKIFSKIKNFDQNAATNSLSKRGINTASLSNEEIFDLWVKQVTGISSRTYISADTFPKKLSEVEYMAEQASLKAIQDADIDVDEIDHILLSTYTAENVIPGPVCALAKFLKIENTSGYTLNGACNGFLDALFSGIQGIISGFYDTVLVVASEYMSNKIDFHDPTTAILFSDGAGACILKKGKKGVYDFSSRILYSNEHINMRRDSVIYMAGGPLVQRKAVNAMHSVTMQALDRSNIAISELGHVIPHQANLRIINSLEDKLKLPPGCTMVKCLKQTGNLSSATIPVAMDLLKKEMIEDHTYNPDSKTVLTSVGGGYTYSAIVVDF